MSNPLPTPEDRELLRRPLHGFLSAAGGPTPAQPRPVWFEYTDAGIIQIFTGPDALRIRHLENDPHASIVVAAPVGEREHWVSVTGRTTVEFDGAHDLATRLAERYWNLDDPGRAGDLAEILTQDWVRLIIHPEEVRRYASP